MNEEIKRLLEAMYRMSQPEDWSESRAQEPIMDGGSLYEKYVLNQPHQ